LVFLGEDSWEHLLDLVEASMLFHGFGAREACPAACEEEEIAEVDEDERYYVLDLSETASEDVEPSDWPDFWEEERIWGDLSPQERRSLERLLGSRAPKWMDT
jgi:hypothetical protein